MHAMNYIRTYIHCRHANYIPQKLRDHIATVRYDGLRQTARFRTNSRIH